MATNTLTIYGDFIITPPPLNPTQITGLKLWYDAKDPYNNGTTPADGTPISTWYNKLGPGKNMANNITNSPTFVNKSFNTYYPGMVFGTSCGMVANCGSLFPTGMTSFGVYFYNPTITLTGTSRAGAIFTKTINGRGSPMDIGKTYRAGDTYTSPSFTGPDLSVSPYTSPVLFCVTIQATPSLWTEYTNGNLTLTYNTSTSYFDNGANYYFIGSSYGNGNLFAGTVAEVLVYTGALTDTDRQKAEGYLAWKWGIQGNLPSGHPYKNFAP
jgi:hypothetical protein